MASTHRGERLKTFLNRKGISYRQFAREVGIHRNTPSTWFEKEALSVENLLQVAQVYPDLVKVFPELDLAPAAQVIEEPIESYTSMQDLSDACKKQIEKYRSKYEELQEKYDTVMEKYIKLLEEKPI